MAQPRCWRMPDTPTERLLGLPFLALDQVKESLHAY
jgi:hypothetical protein